MNEEIINSSIIVKNTISKEILKDKRMKLPISYDCNEFLPTIEKTLKNYIDLLKEYGVNDNIVNVITKRNNKIIEVFNEYLIGHHNEAYRIFQIIMKDMVINNHLIIKKDPENHYYRARINEENIDYKDYEMFHIPLNKRGIVSSQRYSFPGLPCLYLSSSSFTCWVELDRPQFSKFQVALIDCVDSNDYSVIDLSLCPDYVYKELTKKEDILYINDYLCLWPIIAMCSIKVSSDSYTFKQEYIFSQFVLQYVLENKENVTGIKYFSIKASDLSDKQYLSEPVTYTNYVFPVKDFIEDKNHLSKELLRKFSVINNYSGRELEVLSDVIKRSSFSWGTNSKDDILKPSDESNAIYNSNGFPFSYDSSIFRRIENILIKTTKKH